MSHGGTLVVDTSFLGDVLCAEPMVRALAAAGEVVDFLSGHPDLRDKDLLDRGMTPGKEIGRILKQALALQLDGELADREAAVDWLGHKFSEQKNLIIPVTITRNHAHRI